MTSANTVSAAAEANRRSGEDRRSALVEDVEFLVSTGETLSSAWVRLGYRSANSLERALSRAGRYDLVSALKAAERDWRFAEGERKREANNRCWYKY